jgi:CARDB
MSRWRAVFLAAVLVAGCGAAPTSQPPTASPTAPPTPAPATAAPTPVAPAFQVSGLRLASTPAEILPGDDLRYMVQVTNTGTAAGTYEAVFSVDGTVSERQSVTLDVGQDTMLYFHMKAGSPGDHALEVGNAGAILTVLEPAVVAVTGLDLSEAGVPTTGEVAALVTLANQGGAYGTLTVTVKVDGKVAETRPVTVAGGERKTVEIPLAVPRPGRHTVTVGELAEKLVVWKIARPSNGTILVNKVKGGMGRLTVKNGDDERDVVLVLAKSSSPSKAVLAVYVRANKSYTVKSIRDGIYVVYFTFGKRWDSYSKSFTMSPDKYRFEDTVRFRTTRTSTAVRYSIVTISLHQSGGDSAPTDPVGDEDFPTVP